MAKTKNKKRNFADSVRSKKDVLNKTKHNPFDIHVNKQKFSVLGQKLKNDKGLPGISRLKALNKRKKTLLPEFQLQNKSNKFLDRRIGERSKNLTNEDKITARFTAERVKMHKKKSIFNLGDDEILTHKGQTLTEIEKFDDPRSDDEFSDDGKQGGGGLEAGFVSDAHFGGGILSNTGKEGAKSRKDLIDQLIAESKKRKAEKQKLREQTVELTEKLDSQWKDLLPLVNTRKKDDLSENEKNDDFDKVMQELRFEARGQPTDRLKTEDEIAKEEKEKLEKLERDRLIRMKGFVDETESKPKHRSADDLDDNFVHDTNLEPILSYGNDGVLINNITNENAETNVHDNVELDEEDNGSENNFEESSDESETESDHLSDLKDDSESDEDNKQLSDNSEESSDSENNNKFLNIEEGIQVNNEIIVNKENDNLENLNKCTLDKIQSVIVKKKSNEKTSENVSLNEFTNNMKTRLNKNDISELKINSQDTEKNSKNATMVNDVNKKVNALIEEVSNDKNKLAENSTVSKIKQIVTVDTEKIINIESECEKERSDKIRADLLKRKKIMEQAREELPYTYDVPEKYEDLQKLLNEQPPSHQSVILERMIKCNHISLSDSNKEKLSTLFTYVMQYLNDIAINGEDQKDITRTYQILDNIISHIYDLAQMDKENAHNTILEILKEKQNDYRENYKQYPSMDTLIFLKLITFLFPTSDFRHQIVTPALVFIGQMLTECNVKSRRDIATGLFLVTLVLEYTFMSKRFLPPAINFLRGVIYMTVWKPLVSMIRVIPPFKATRGQNSLLVLNECCSVKTDLIMKSSDFMKTNINNEFKVRAFWCALRLCSEFYVNLESLDSSCEIFEPILDLLLKVNGSFYPNEVQEELNRLIFQITNGQKNKKFEFLMYEKKKPKALRLYEPNIQKVFDTKKHRVMSKEKAEREKLVHKYKKEMKGALREIRKDNVFLRKLKMNKQVESDLERKRKVKEIFSNASIQQSELNTLYRKRKKK